MSTFLLQIIENPLSQSLKDDLVLLNYPDIIAVDKINSGQYSIVHSPRGILNPTRKQERFTKTAIYLYISGGAQLYPRFIIRFPDKFL